MADSRAEIQILRDEFRSLRNQNTDFQNQITDLQNQNTDLRNQITDLRSRTVELENHAAVAAGYMENAFKVNTQYQETTTRGEVSKALNASIVSCVYEKAYPKLFSERKENDKRIYLHEIQEMRLYTSEERTVNPNAPPLSHANVLAEKLEILSKSRNDQNHSVIPMYKPILIGMFNDLPNDEHFKFRQRIGFHRNAIISRAVKILENKLQFVPLSKPPTKPAKRARLSLQPVKNPWKSSIQSF